MPFTPLRTVELQGLPDDVRIGQRNQTPAGWKVSQSEQAQRDAAAANIVATEYEDETDPAEQEKIAREYRLRFKSDPPTNPGATAQSGFVPLEQPTGFVPLEAEKKSILGQVALENPLTAIGETALYLGSQAVALPVAGIAGLATEAGNALGLTDKKGADVVEQVAGAMTYQPRGEMGKQATGIVAYPFEKLAEAGQWAGGKTLEATDSPALATAVDTTIQGVLPMLAGPAGKKAATKVLTKVAAPEPVFDPAAGPISRSLHEAQQAMKPKEAVTAEKPVGDQGGFVPLEVVEGAEAQPRPVAQPKPEPLAVENEMRTPMRQEKRVDFDPDKAVSQVSTEQSGFVPLEEAPAMSAIDRAAHEAATSPLNDLPQPTPAQLEAGQYRKGRASVHGLDLDIENPRGSVRSGVDRDGNAWRTEMQDHYGYIRDVVGADKDHLDAFIGPKEQTGKVYVVDQIDPKTGRFDEHKTIFGAESPIEARSIYERNYDHGWRGLGAMTEMEPQQFKQWIAGGETKEPVSLYRDAPTTGVKVFDDTLLESNRAMMPGANYVPLVDDVAGVKGVSITDKPIRREDVLRPLAKALGVPLYQGRVKGKALGTYTPRKEVVRLKKANDIEVAAHELAHLIDDRIPELGKQYRADKTIAGELRAVSYDKTKIHEGFAELVRLWATQPEKAKAAAPHAYQWFESFVNGHEYGKPLRKAQADMTAWFGQDALHRAQSKIGGTKTINDAIDGLWDKFRQSVSDDLHGVYKMERDLIGKISPVGAYETARLSRASNSITEGAIRYGRPVKKADGSYAYEGLGLEKIIEPVAGRLDDFLLYAVGRSAKELMAQKRENLFTSAEIDAMLNLKQDGFEKAFAQYQAWNRGVLDFAQAHGVINAESRKLWSRSAYMPFHRVGQAGEAKGAKPGEWSGVKALTGGTENLRDILGNMVGNAATLIEKSIQNDSRLKIAQMADSETGGGRFMVRIPAESRPVRIPAKQVADAVLQKLGVDLKKPLSHELSALQAEILKQPEFFDFMLGNQTPAGSNVVAVMRNGKRDYYEVGDPVLYRSLLALDREPQHWMTQWLGIPKRIGQATITLTPDFMIANIARDTLMGAVMSRAGFRPVIDSMNGMRLRLTNDPLYKDFIANGGGLSSMLLDERRLRHHLERFYSKKGIDYRTVMDAPDKLLLGIETIADAFEMSTRLGEYKRAIDRGDNPRHAAYLGREVSTDFAMKGDSKTLGFFYDTVMFLRPMVSSFDRLYRGLAHDENRGAIATKTGLLALSSMALYMLNKDNPEFQDLPDWDRDGHWHFFVPTADGSTVHLRYPKIWEIGAVASTAERTLEKLMNDDPAGLGKDVGRILANTFHFNLMPQAFAPLYQQATNRNGFTGARIETPGMESLQPFLRAKPNTSETMKAAGMATRNLPESLQVNPVRAEALLRGYFNTWALYGLTIADETMFGDKLPEKRLDQMPVVRRFYEGKPAIHTRHEEMFYEILGEASRLQHTMRRLDKIGRQDIADEKESEPLATKAKQLERVQKRLHSINEEIQLMHRTDLSREEKRQKIDSLIAERNDLMKATVMEIKP